MEVIVPHITKTNKQENTYEAWLAHLDENPFNYEFLRCTTKKEIEEKFPTWTCGGPPELCSYGDKNKEAEDAEAPEEEKSNDSQ